MFRSFGGVQVREEVKWWLKAAERNVERAEASIERGDFEAAAFWAQQAVEFSLRALILFKGEIPPKTHNLVELHRLVSDLLSGVREELLSELTPYYSVSRYPDIFMGVPVVHRSTAERFLQFSRELFERVRGVIEHGVR
ncbi:MAG: HEPN domain-containing protein [Thermofilaceae archaeon]